MPTTYQQIISCHQLHELLYPTGVSSPAVDTKIPQTNLIILDASIPPVGKMKQPKQQWPNYALPSAQRFDLNEKFSDVSNPLPHTMPGMKQFQQQARALGVMSDAQIVVYDDQGLFSAARAWYMFRSMGHKNVAVLDGGLPAWLKLGFPVSPSKNPTIEIGNFTAEFYSNYFCNGQYIFEHLNSTDNLVVDARINTRFEGLVAEPRKGMRRGHIPNSVNLPFSDLLENGELLPKSALIRQFKKINNMKKPMIMSCGSGVTACVLALAADICGYKQINVYDGSWSEWGVNQRYPVITAK
jgi:thiosulfate/3-mercaptopyruvate sulfurtransferase